MAQRLKRLPVMRETWVRSLGQEDPLEKEMATHSSILAWRIPWMEEPGGLQCSGSQRVGHDWVTSLSLSGSKCIHILSVAYRSVQSFWGEHPCKTCSLSKITEATELSCSILGTVLRTSLRRKTISKWWVWNLEILNPLIKIYHQRSLKVSKMLILNCSKH